MKSDIRADRHLLEILSNRIGIRRIKGVKADPGGSWWVLVDPGGSWWVLVDPGGSWWIVVDRGGSWWIVVDPGIHFFHLAKNEFNDREDLYGSIIF
jgi:hypothetical protein